MENEENQKAEEINVTEDSSVVISEEVVSVIAGVAVSEVSGVVDTAGGFAGGLSEVLSGKKKLSKGIKVEVGEKETKIDVNIIVEYGIRIPDIAFEIQSKVKKSVKEMTGLDVLAVNVHVQGVRTSLELESKDENKN